MHSKNSVILFEYVSDCWCTYDVIMRWWLT